MRLMVEGEVVSRSGHMRQGLSNHHRNFCVIALLALIASAAIAPAHSGTNKIEIVPILGHSASVLSVAFSPDGAQVLSGGHDSTVKLWDTATGGLIHTFGEHSNPVHSVAFSPNGAHVLSGSADTTLKLWDSSTGLLIHTYEGHTKAVLAVAFSHDGARVLSGSADNTIKLWDVGTGHLIRSFKGHVGPVSSVTFSPGGDRALSSSTDRTLRLWDTETGAMIRTFKGHNKGANSVAFSADGARALSGSNDATIKLWDAANGLPIRTFEGQDDEIFSVAFSPDGVHALSGGSTLKLWDVETGAPVRRFAGHRSLVWSVSFSADGKRAVSGGADHTIRLWDVTTGTLIRTFRGNSAPINSVAYSAGSGRVLSGGGDHTHTTLDADKRLTLWDAGTGAPLLNFDGHSYLVWSVALSKDGARVLSGSFDSTLKLWDAATGALIHSFEHSDAVWAAALSADGRRVLSGGGDKKIKLWDVATGRLVRAFEDHSGRVLSVAFSADDARVLSGSADNTIKLWDAASGHLIRTFNGHLGPVSSVTFSPGGDRALSSSMDRTLRLWDTETGEIIRTFEGHTRGVNSAAFSADSMRIVSGSNDKTVKLWDAQTGVLIRTFEGHSDSVLSVSFANNGARVLSGSADSTVRIWKLETSSSNQWLASLLGARDGSWLTMTPQGFFAGYHDADILSIVRGLQLTSVDQVHQSLFNPDLVRESLAGDPNGEVREAAEVLNLDKVLDSGPAPAVAIAAPADSSSATDLTTVTARITDNGKGVGRVEWRVNGVTAAVASGPEGGRPGPIYSMTREVALDPGKNIIEVVAYNGSNLLASLPARVTVTVPPDKHQIKPKLHVLAIGIDKYVDKGWIELDRGYRRIRRGFPELKLAVKDAEAFGSEMRRAGARMYQEVIVTRVLDELATRENLDQVVDRIAKDVHPRDTFILFAAAHGTSENGRFYLIPQNYQGGSGALQERAIGQDQLQDWLANRIKARKAIILLDTCESGALIAGHLRSRTEEAASEAGVGRLHEATGRPVLTAAATGQFAHEGVVAQSGERHGIFTWALLDALKKGDSNTNGKIELSELVAHVQSEVPKITAQYGGVGRTETATPKRNEQTARLGSRGENFVIVDRLR